MSTAPILIVEDEPKLAQLLVEYFQQAGFSSHCIGHGDEVLPWLQQHHAAAIILDLMLPGTDGLTLCKAIRQFSDTPILITTAKVEEIDRLLGLELGADDYICKPYSMREVVARVKAILRRLNSPPLQHAGFELDPQQQCIQFQGLSLHFTTVEYQLLSQLALQPGRIFSRSQLMNGMYQDHRVVSDRTIDSHIKKLRKKLQQHYPQYQFLHAIYGAGYRFELITTE